ncbi:MAG: SprB repeat-containing protein [Bacteroidia bacterium]|nr:SprB repeat-containing protein [Bacteroidia bacterium]
MLLLLSLGVSGQSLDVTFNPSVFNGGYNVSCNGASDGTLEAIIVGGQPPYSFQWSTGAYTKTITNLAAGTYSISVIDAAQDTITKSYTLIASEALTGSLDVSTYGGGFNVSAQGAADGWITAVIGGGATPYTYQWSNGAETETNHDLPSGSYSVIVRDVNQCQLQLSTNLTQPTPLHIVSITSPLHNGYNLSCKSSDDGAIDLTVSGGVAPYTYQWSNGNFTQDLADLKAGEYTVLVKDLNGVGVTASITLTQPGSIEVDLTAPTYPNGHHTTCYNCSNGSVTTTVTGGVMPYTYSWNTGQNTQNLSNLMAGTYSVLVTDANGCTKPDVKIDLTEPDRDDWTMMGNTTITSGVGILGTLDTSSISIQTNNTERVLIDKDGVVSLRGRLQLFESSTDSTRDVFVNQDGELAIYNPANNGVPCLRPTNNWIQNGCDSGSIVFLKDSSISVAVGANSVPAGFKLAVGGKMIAEEVRVQLKSQWPDFVFEDSYTLMPISLLKEYIDEHKHLPDLPSGGEIEREGIDTGKLLNIAFKKIEELSLYIIEQNERISKLENELSDLK